MQCPYCGTNNPPKAKFCPECGGQLNNEPEVETPYVPGTQPSDGQSRPTPPQMPAQSQANTTSAKRKRRPAVVVGIVAAFTVLLAVTVVGVVACSTIMGGHVGFGSNTHGVIFRINISNGYDTSSSRIPVQITGTDIDGNNVDKTVFLAYSGVDVELPEGTYEAKVVGSPISSSGTIYKIPEFVAHFELSGLDPDETYELPGSQAFSFIAIDPEDLTDEQVEDAIAWARKDEQSGADVGTLEKAIERRRNRTKS